ncbi:MAG: hypothetical protein U1E36_09160 [Rickettsiales bacterium]
MHAPPEEQQNSLPSDTQNPTGEKNSLRIAGTLNAIGDIGLLADGFKSTSVPFKLAGWFYTAGAAAAVLFGTTSKDRQVRDLTERAAEFVQARNENKDADVESAEILKHRNNGLFANAARAMRRYSGQIMLGFYTLGAGAMLTHGIEGYKADKAAGKNLLEARGTIAYGIASLTVKALSFLVTERSEEAKISPDTPKGILGWLQDKPMRIFGYGSLVTDSLMGLRTYGKYKKSRHEAAGAHMPQATGWQAFKSGYGWSALTTGSYLLSDVIITSANKDAANAVGKLHNGEQEKIENMMAETIARQPVEKQEKLSAEAAEFLEKECMVCGPTENLRSSLLSKVKELAQKPATTWVESQQPKDMAPAPARI